MRRRFALLLVLVATLGAAACDNAPVDSPVQETQQRLVGTWLRDFDEDGVHVRRVLVLGADGHFDEAVRITDGAGAVTEHRHAGEWLYDGTNLKRRYTRMDGGQQSAPGVGGKRLRGEHRHQRYGPVGASSSAGENRAVGNVGRRLLGPHVTHRRPPDGPAHRMHQQQRVRVDHVADLREASGGELHLEPGDVLLGLPRR